MLENFHLIASHGTKYTYGKARPWKGMALDQGCGDIQETTESADLI